MFADKVREYISSNQALQMWHRLSDSEIDILKDFAAWLDENAVEQSRALDAANAACPKCGRELICNAGDCDFKTTPRQ